MAGSTASSATFLHLGLEQVRDPADQLRLDATHVLDHRPVVLLVELLDDLEGPPPIDHVAADDVAFHGIGDLVVSRGAQQVHRVAELKVSVPHQLVEREQVTARTFDVLDRFGELAGCLDRCVRDPVGTTARSRTVSR